MKTIRWGIIGCGDVTEVKSGPGFQQASNSALVAVMRRNGELAADYARRHSVPKWYDDGQALIDDPDVDAVYIATPPNAHMAYTLAAAKAGKPVYVEKPMAMNFDECWAMIEACQVAGVPLWVAYYRRALPRFLKVKELIDSGAIGTPRTVTVTFYRKWRPAEPGNLPWRVLPEIAGGGLFVDLAAHTLDYLDYFLGPIQFVQGYASNQAGYYPAEDVKPAKKVHMAAVTEVEELEDEQADEDLDMMTSVADGGGPITGAPPPFEGAAVDMLVGGAMPAPMAAPAPAASPCIRPPPRPCRRTRARSRSPTASHSRATSMRWRWVRPITAPTSSCWPRATRATAWPWRKRWPAACPW